MTFWMLDKDGTPVTTTKVLEWAAWYEGAHEDDSITVERTQVGAVWVSTVFLGGPDLPGISGRVYETMSFGGSRDQRLQYRYGTREEAVRGHAFACAQIRRDLKHQTDDAATRRHRRPS